MHFAHLGASFRDTEKNDAHLGTLVLLPGDPRRRVRAERARRRAAAAGGAMGGLRAVPCAFRGGARAAHEAPLALPRGPSSPRKRGSSLKNLGFPLPRERRVSLGE